MVWILTGVGVVFGVLAGWLARSLRRDGDSRSDWRTRLAARDEDLQAVMRQLADRVVELERANAELDRLRRGPSPRTEGGQPEAQGVATDDEVRELQGMVEAFSERAEMAEEEAAALRAAAARPVTDSELGRRVEELEAELMTLESFRCPDPAAHRASEATPKPTFRVVGSGADDAAR